MGLYSILLLIGAVNGLLLAGLILRGRVNPWANRVLAGLIGLVILRVSVYIIGYAGAYDRWRWLTFAPLDWSLAFGPLLWAYVLTLTGGRMPRRMRWHLAPVALQVAYASLCFTLPLDAKWAWYTGPANAVIGGFIQLFGLAQQGVYMGLALRHCDTYVRSASARVAPQARRLRWMLAAFALHWLVASGYALWSLFISPLDFFQRFPVMIAFCLLIYALGLFGWRFGGLVWPALNADREGADRRYGAQAATWRRRIEEAGWWREDTLSLSEVARRLGVSERSLSRGLSEGLGESFNTLINRMRVEAVQARIDAGASQDLLSLAYESGFASKASFNRAFRTFTGHTPSAYRQAASQNPPIVTVGKP